MYRKNETKKKMQTHIKARIIELVDNYWKFDDDQFPVSTLHDKNDLLDEIEKVFKEKPKSSINELADDFKKYTKELLSSEEKVSKFLQDAGIHDDKGELTEQYKRKE